MGCVFGGSVLISIEHPTLEIVKPMRSILKPFSKDKLRKQLYLTKSDFLEDLGVKLYLPENPGKSVFCEKCVEKLDVKIDKYSGKPFILHQCSRESIIKDI